MSDNLMGNFRRDISFQLCDGENGRILLTGSMRDVYHDILMEVVVNGASLVIESAQVEFRKCPEDECQRAAQRLERLTGVTIGKGLNKKILDALGGGEGCGNLRLLLTGLLPLAMNVKAAEGFDNVEDMMGNIREKLRGSCAGYPEAADSQVTEINKET